MMLYLIYLIAVKTSTTGKEFTIFIYVVTRKGLLNNIRMP